MQLKYTGKSSYKKIHKKRKEGKNIRNTKNIHPSKKSELIIITPKYAKEILEAEEILLKLGFADKIEVYENKEALLNNEENKEKLDNSMSIILSDIEVYIPLKGLIDIEEERNRLKAEVTRLEGEVARGEKMLSNPGFVNKAPEAKVNEEKEKLAKYKEMLESAKERLEKLK